ncbi:MAG: 16S rRNA (guanine(527)-N(7))-methyltransferase RsmG [Pseudomonadota bacterium]
MDLKDVSRETRDDLEVYVSLLLKWTKSINLIGKSTKEDVWGRHIADSLQLWPLIRPTDKALDLGSGGGLPAVVLAILSKHDQRFEHITMIEADLRKSTFLQTCIRTLGLKASVLTRRISDAPPQDASLVTARALASLDTLCEMAHQHAAPGAQLLFPKGERAGAEIAQAQENWRFSLIEHPSKTDHKATILELGDLARV